MDTMEADGTGQFLTDHDVAELRAAIQCNGYAIGRQVVAPAEIEALRAHWLEVYAGRAEAAPIIWGPYLGEPNRVLFHDSPDCCMFRSYDFLWNPPQHDLTRDVGLRLSRLRNRIAEVDLRSGEYFEADGYGIYITTSYYPAGRGRLAVHEDRTDARRHWHFMLLLTHKGTHYHEGGLFLVDRKGTRVEVDAEVQLGDAIFFDGSRPHGVDTIEPANPDGIGRLQLFSIPTLMEQPAANDRCAEAMSMGRFVKAKLRPIKRRLFGVRGGGYAPPGDMGTGA